MVRQTRTEAADATRFPHMLTMAAMVAALNLTDGEAASNLAHDHAQVVPISIFAAVLCLCLLFGHLFEGNRWLNESIVAIVVGCIAGIILLLLTKGKSSHILIFDEEFFFLYLLPPIIFNAGFQVKKKQFFHNFLIIMLFGVIGVFISSLIITTGSWWIFPKLNFLGLTVRDYLAIGVIFSSTDTVCTLQVLHQDETPLLYSIVFGEGVVNDATSVVLFNAVQKIDVSKLNGKTFGVLGNFLYLFSASTCLGVVVSSSDEHCMQIFLCFLLIITKNTSFFSLSMLLAEICIRNDTNPLNQDRREIKVINWISKWSFREKIIKAGLLTSYLLKALSFGRHSSVREVALMVLMAYLSYMLAELLELSGILTVFFCGIFMSHYAWHNVTETSRITTRYVFAAMSFIAETFIFLYVGMDALDLAKWKMTELSFGNLMGIYSSLIFLILLGRAAFVFPLSAFYNYMNRRSEQTPSITFQHQIIIWWAGLMRGAVSIALAFKQFTYSGVTSDPVNATMITNTIIVVLFSTLGFGFLTKPLIRYLLPHTTTRRNISREESGPPVVDLNLPLLSFEESTATNISRAKESLSMLIESPVYTIHYYWRRFDDSYMRPIFGGPRRNNSVC
ncbi:sodium/hydrogen exchanger 4 [Lotus japonicus]|uniref:sodium/hydrogen exchanger 4 n=1 Tax=Lotus japonicus TaxID=34305 RepID=UPI00258FDD7C|nr:sodium/hydrogen exchanger 4 [Lotus japonicus]